MAQLNGTIHHIGDTQKVSDKFKKREFIVITEQSTPYPQYIKLEFTQDKCEILDKYFEGMDVSVDYNLRGNLHPRDQKVAFVTLQAWKIEKVNG